MGEGWMVGKGEGWMVGKGEWLERGRGWMVGKGEGVDKIVVKREGWDGWKRGGGR